MSVAENLALIKQEIATAAMRVGRDPGSVKVIAVTKNVSAAKARESVAAGVVDLGENRVQELQNKYPEVEGVSWHLIGHLQTNKVKYMIDKVALAHSLDRWSLALELDQRARQIEKVIPVLVQVNVAEEESKFGLHVNEVKDFITEAAQLKGISIEGLMTIAPFVDNPEEVRPVFKQLKQMAVSFNNIPGVKMEQLSMGMTNDYKVAIEEGSTMVRIGTAIFGERQY